MEIGVSRCLIHTMSGLASRIRFEFGALCIGLARSG
jgi:hypothetical protein